jgi:uncharacterized membrane protein (Fun14 family)
MGGTLAGGIPSLVVMAIPLIIGIAIGYLLRKALMVAIILLVVALVLSYFGFVSLASLESTVKSLVTTYGPIASTYVAIFFGIIPLSIGLIIGVIIGFIV